MTIPRWPGSTVRIGVGVYRVLWFRVLLAATAMALAFSLLQEGPDKLRAADTSRGEIVPVTGRFVPLSQQCLEDLGIELEVLDPRGTRVHVRQIVERAYIPSLGE